MNGNIDPYTIATNGLLTTDSKTIIIDPLGYYVLFVEEEIIEVPDDSFGGGYASPLIGVPTKKIKKVKVCVKFNDKIDDFCEEFYLDNFNLKVTDAKLIDDNSKILLTIKNPNLIDSNSIPDKPIVKVLNIKL